VGCYILCYTGALVDGIKILKNRTFPNVALSPTLSATQANHRVQAVCQSGIVLVAIVPVF